MIPTSHRAVEITWASGKVDRVDLAESIIELAALAEIDNPLAFSAVAVGEGTGR